MPSHVISVSQPCSIALLSDLCNAFILVLTVHLPSCQNCHVCGSGKSTTVIRPCAAECVKANVAIMVLLKCVSSVHQWSRLGTTLFYLLQAALSNKFDGSVLRVRETLGSKKKTKLTKHVIPHNNVYISVVDNVLSEG